MPENTSDKNFKGKYEQIPQESDFLVTYHLAETVAGFFTRTPAHWHEHIELLYVLNGELSIFVQGKLILAKAGDLVVINPGEIHAIPEKPKDTVYECLIPHKLLCTRMSLPMEELTIDNLVRDEKYGAAFRQITGELRLQPDFYKLSVQLNLLSLLIGLFRDHAVQTESDRHPSVSPKEQTIKKAIEYIHEHYTEDISTDTICSYLGFDKSYLCNIFRAGTGSTLLDYLNMTRCEHARELLLSGTASVAECASISGFHHQSYFTKTYKRYIGELPSVTAGLRLQNSPPF